jgi:3-methylcrotonyl-CoA carboxylase beta subunit
MGGEQAGMVLSQVRRKSAAARSEENDEEFRSSIKAQYERQSTPYYASARLWDDGIIDPIETRGTLGLSLAATLGGPLPEESPFGIFRM